MSRADECLSAVLASANDDSRSTLRFAIGYNENGKPIFASVRLASLARTFPEALAILAKLPVASVSLPALKGGETIQLRMSPRLPGLRLACIISWAAQLPLPKGVSKETADAELKAAGIDGKDAKPGAAAA